MILVYQAKNSPEAHLILNLFEQTGLTARIDGEYLQGGMGELQVFGNVRVLIAEADYEQGKEIIKQWESSEIINIPSYEIDGDISNNNTVLINNPIKIQFKYLVLLFIILLLISYILYKVPQPNIECFHCEIPEHLSLVEVIKSFL